MTPRPLSSPPLSLRRPYRLRSRAYGGWDGNLGARDGNPSAILDRPMERVRDFKELRR